MTLARLMVLLHLDSAGFVRGLAQAQQQLAIFRQGMAGMAAGANLQNLGRGLTYGLTVPILAAATAIGIAGSQLTEQMGRVQSVIATPGNLQSPLIAQWTDDVQALATTLGRTSPEVAGGLYEIVSAFGTLPNSIDFLSIAGRTAVAGQSDLITSTKNLSLAVRAWGDDSTQAIQRMADLSLETVKVGTLTEQELGGALSNILPVAKLYGVRLEEVFAGLSSLSGVSGTASQASTQLARAITSLVSPNQTMLKLYKQFGIASGETLISQKGLAGAFQEIVRISNETDTPLQKMLGRLEAVKAVATLTGPQFDTYREHLDGLADAAGAVDTAFAGTTQGIDSAAFQWAQAMQRLRTIGEDLYLSFAPAVGNVASALSPIGKGLETVAQAVAGMDTDRLTAIVTVLLGLAALGPVISIIGSIATTLGALKAAAALLAGPVGLAALAIGALAFALYLVKDDLKTRWYNLLDGIRDRADNVKEAIGHLQEAWDKFRNPPKQSGPSQHIAHLKDVAKAAGEVVVAIAKPKQSLTEFQQAMIDQAPKAQSAWDLFWGGFKDNWPDFSQLGADIGALWSSITSGAAGAGVGISSGINPAVMGVSREFGSMYSSANASMLKIPPAAKGAASGAKGAFTSVGWVGVGSSIASGIASGITSGASWIASAARSAASSALSAAKSALGINSPSRVFQNQVGLMIPAGLAAGINQGGWMVNQALNRLVTLPALGAGGGMGGLALVGAGGGGGGSTTTIEISFGDIIVNGGSSEAGPVVVESITQALQRRGLV